MIYIFRGRTWDTALKVYSCVELCSPKSLAPRIAQDGAIQISGIKLDHQD